MSAASPGRVSARARGGADVAPRAGGERMGLAAIVVGRSASGEALLAEPRLDLPGLFEWREGDSVRLFRLALDAAAAEVVEVTDEWRTAPQLLKARLRALARARRQRLAVRRAEEAAERRAVEEGSALRANEERKRHDEIFIMPRAPFDDVGPDSRPQRVADRWIRMAREGMIDGISLKAAQQFRRDFAVAGLERLHAAPLELKVDGSGMAEPERADAQIDAGNAVWAALAALGGLSRPSGSIVYTCVGHDRAVKEWCWQEGVGAGRHRDEKRASGILIGALSALGAHYLDRDQREEVRLRFRSDERRRAAR